MKWLKRLKEKFTTNKEKIPMEINTKDGPFTIKLTQDQYITIQIKAYTNNITFEEEFLKLLEEEKNVSGNKN